MEDDSEPINKNNIYLWRRFFARWIDWYIIKTIYVGLLDPNSWVIEYNNTVAMTMGGLFMWVFLETGLLANLGYTPGKALWGIKVTLKGEDKISYLKALRRSFHVYVRGSACGFPFLFPIVMLFSARDLKKNGITDWDKEGGFEVTHADISGLRLCVNGLIISIMLFFAYQDRF